MVSFVIAFMLLHRGRVNAPAPGAIRLGTAMTDITPPEFLPLGGYTERQGRVSVAGGHPLFARAVVLQQGKLRVAVVSAEMLTIPKSLEEAVEAQIPTDVHLMLCATHTHCAPDSQMLNDRMTFQLPGIASFKPRWLRWYAAKIAGVVNAALAAPAKVENAVTVDEWHADANRGRRKGADPQQTAVVVTAKGASSFPMFFEYAAHATFYDADMNQTQEDWPGLVGMVAFEALIGAIGDVSPMAPGLDHAPAPERIAGFWKTILAGRKSGHTFTAWKAPQAVGFATVPIPLAKKEPSPAFISSYKAPPAIANILVQKFAPDAVSIHALRLGSLAIVGVPGEPTSHLGRAIVAAGTKLGYKAVLVISHCDGWMGYILDPIDYSHGGYEASLSFYGADEGNVVVSTAVKALKQLRN